MTIYFGVAPAVAPLVGGWLFVSADWHAIFWFLALISAALCAVLDEQPWGMGISALVEQQPLFSGMREVY